jgi:hypothetical protein
MFDKEDTILIITNDASDFPQQALMETMSSMGSEKRTRSEHTQLTPHHAILSHIMLLLIFDALADASSD